MCAIREDNVEVDLNETADESELPTKQIRLRSTLFFSTSR